MKYLPVKKSNPVEEIDRSKLKSKINIWKPKKSEIMVEQD